MTGTNQTPSTLHPVSEAFARTAHIGSRAAYDELCAEAQKDHTGYWSRLAREFLTWHKPFTRALDESNAPFYRWFDDGQLNASYNCLDRHVEAGRGDPQARLARFARQLPKLRDNDPRVLVRADLRYTNGFTLVWGDPPPAIPNDTEASPGSAPAGTQEGNA